MQSQHPLAYISKALGPRQQAMSIYETELLVIVYAFQKRGAYLSHAPFVFKTNRKSMENILEQRLHTPFQQVWVSKLMGLNLKFTIKKGHRTKLLMLFLENKELNYFP